jgi:DNA-binding transcriptional regulator YhcF (GntR family)
VPEQTGRYRILPRKAGSIVIDRLRDRILLGRYFGQWDAGDRLPSVREVAALEDVDRKTAAAAYRRLREEGLVRVEPRSGVYLREDGRPDGMDPLGRLHLQWLEQTLASAAELGLDSEGIRRLFQGLATVEKRRIPVIDDDADHARIIAEELAQRTGFEFAAIESSRIPHRLATLREAPLVVATPLGAGRLSSIRSRIPLVRATLSPALLGEVLTASARGPVRVVVGTDSLRHELESALERGLVEEPEHVTVIRASTPAEVEAACEEKGAVVVWPGTAGRCRSVDRIRDLRSSRLLSKGTVADVRAQMVRAALEVLSRSNAGATT